MYKITQINGVKTYNMSAGKTYTQFFEEAKKNHKSLRYDEDFKRRIQLIQDFQFDIATSQVEISNDQRYIVATGIYGPQIKIYDTSQLSLKCLRGLDSEVVKFKILSNDYSKIVMAQHDRSIDFHAQYGAHYKTRIPNFPRDIQFNTLNSNLCISASANEVYRISLEEGKFLAPFHTDSMINSLDFNQKLNVLSCGGDSLEIWDFRERKKVCALETSGVVTCVKSDPSGLLIGVGNRACVDLYDVRFNRKLTSIRASYNEPINTIHFMQDHKKSIVFSNSKQIKITDTQGNFFTNIEPDSKIARFSIVPDSGMILAAMEDPKIGCFFIPELGPAPKWVPFIQNITQELEEEEKKVVYDQYKFVSKNQVNELNCSNLIGTKLLKEYMHGYLMHLKLYNRLKDKIELVNYKSSREEVIRRRIEEEEAPQLVQKKQVVDDNRFSIMKNNPEFAIDRFSQEYMLRHPHMKKQLLKQKYLQEQKLLREMRVNKKKMISKKDGLKKRTKK